MATLVLKEPGTASIHEKSSKGRLYVDSNALDLVIDWYSNNEIWKLNQKSKAWGKVKRAATSLVCGQLKTIKGVESAVFSNRAGCACGCSPGYIVTGTSWYRKYAWVDLTFEESELNKLKKAMELALPILETEKASEVIK